MSQHHFDWFFWAGTLGCYWVTGVWRPRGRLSLEEKMPVPCLSFSCARWWLWELIPYLLWYCTASQIRTYSEWQIQIATESATKSSKLSHFPLAVPKLQHSLSATASPCSGLFLRPWSGGIACFANLLRFPRFARLEQFAFPWCPAPQIGTYSEIATKLSLASSAFCTHLHQKRHQFKQPLDLWSGLCGHQSWQTGAPNDLCWALAWVEWGPSTCSCRGTWRPTTTYCFTLRKLSCSNFYLKTQSIRTNKI